MDTSRSERISANYNEPSSECCVAANLAISAFTFVILLIAGSGSYYDHSTVVSDGGPSSSVWLEDELWITLERNEDRIHISASNQEWLAEYEIHAAAELIEKNRRMQAALVPQAIAGDEDVEAYRKRLAQQEQTYWTEAHELSDVILGPIADQIKRRRINVIASGEFQSISFGALPRPYSRVDEPILITNEIEYKNSEADKVSEYLPLETSSPGRRMLIVGDPDFSSDDDRAFETTKGMEIELRSESGGRLPTRLPGSGDEARSIAQLAGPANSTFLTGPSAVREAVLNPQISDYGVLHIATHGYVDETDPDRSGLILSGSASGSTGLSVADITNVKVNADLVVLSGCETGRGIAVDGKMVSLKDAFLHAGAKNVVSSLWKVDDTATAELMIRFHHAMLADGLPPAAALRAAQLDLYQTLRFRSPFYWAAFTVHGN
ncbi:MAG: CHAT domain-containing protein [Pyrinomonadaceae bacterium]